ncbi:MAG: DUF3276 family protein [Rikenellaceae bacterium]
MGIFNFSKSGHSEEAEPQTNETAFQPTFDGGSADEVFSVPVKAGKRIYYFDVKATRAEDYYITITESRKKQLRDGSFTIDKHKIHLYKEDFAKFAEGFSQVVEFVKKNKPEFFENEANFNSEE